jgi:branched-chain amino acid transport system permease protein
MIARRSLLMFAGLFVLFTIIGLFLGAANISLLLVQSFAYALIALGLNIQWGYGGLFNFGIMGMLMLGGAAVTFISYPVNAQFWGSEGPLMLGKALMAFLAGFLLVWGGAPCGPHRHQGTLEDVRHRHRLDRRLYRLSQPDRSGGSLYRNGQWRRLGRRPRAAPGAGLAVRRRAGGRRRLCRGQDLPWAAHRLPRHCHHRHLGDHPGAAQEHGLADARDADRVADLVADADPQDLQAQGVSISDSFIYARLGFLGLVIVILAVAFFLVQRAYGGPWGRMMRSIRDNHIAAGSMGKNVTRRQLEIFVLGSVLMGIGGAMLVSFQQIYDPGAYQPINHTFLIWVMVIVGGAGNNWGAVFGALLIYITWMISDPLSQWLFNNVSNWSTDMGWGAIPEIQSRASQMRVFVLGVVITIALRYAPRGLIPEVVKREA